MKPEVAFDQHIAMGSISQLFEIFCCCLLA